MNKSSLVGVLLLVAALAGAMVWLLTGESAAPTLVPAAGAPVDPAVTPVEVAKAKAAAAEAQLAANERTGVPIERTAVSSGFAILGVVVDDAGQAVAGASVSCMTAPDLGGGRGRGQGGIDWANFDPADFDPTAMIEQLRAQVQERAQATTDALGHFRLVPTGTGRDVMLRVAARGHQLLDRAAARPAAADVDLGTLQLSRGAVVSGRVVDRQGAPVEGAKVSRRARGEAQMGFDFEFPGADLVEQLRDGDGGVADANGCFELANVAPGSFSLRARHPDHPLARLDGLEVAVGQVLANVLVVVEPGGVISGRVIDVPAATSGLRVQATARQAGSGGQPGSGQDLMQMVGEAREMLADAGMPIGEKSVEIGADGAFQFRGLELDKTYRLVVAQSGRGFVGNGACSEPKDAAAGTVGVELRFDPGITVTCRVVDAGTKAAVERLWVSHRLQGGGGGIQDLMAGFLPANRAKDYPGGQITLTSLRPKPKQTLTLSIEAIGYGLFERQDIALPASGNLDLGTVELRSVPVLRVQVLANAGGKPVVGASVQLRQQQPQQRGGRRGNGGAGADAFAAAMGQFANMGGSGASGTHGARTDAEGRCVLNGTPGAAATLAVTAREHAPWESEVTLPADRDLEQKVTLLIGGSVEVTVLDADGKAMAKAGVEHAPPLGRRATEASDADGRVVFAHLAPGAHRFRIGERRGRGPDMAALAQQFGGGRGADDSGWQSVEVADGAVSQLQLAKSATASLRGIVRENGAPLGGVSITFLQGPGSGADGREDLMAGAMAQFGGRGRGRSGNTGDDGSYALKELPAGQHRLRVSHRGRVMPTVVDLNLRLGDNVVDIDLEATALRGIVRDPQGAPVAGATVSVRRAGAGEDPMAQLAQGMPGVDLGAMTGRTSVKTGDDGSYELRGVASGVKLVVSAAAKGMARSTSAEVELAPGSERNGIDIALGAAGSIKVTASGGGMFAAARATCLGADGNADASVSPAMQMLRRGSGVIDGLRPGRWKVEMVGAGGAEGEAKIVEVVAGETVTVSF